MTDALTRAVRDHLEAHADVGADVPVVSRITRASRAEPYLALAIELDMALLLELSAQMRGAAAAGRPAAAGMSASTFHHHFRAITSLSPMQFQKQLRLIEARRCMLSEGWPANRAAFAVGYESVTQFTREYARMFGLPLGRDARARFVPLESVGRKAVLQKT